MSKLVYQSKSQDYDMDNKPSYTRVILSNPEGAYIPVLLPAEYITKSTQDLLDAALDKLYEENFPMRFQDERFKEYDSVIKKIYDKYRELEQVVDEYRATSLEAQQMMLDISSKMLEEGVIEYEDSVSNPPSNNDDTSSNVSDSKDNGNGSGTPEVSIEEGVPNV